MVFKIDLDISMNTSLGTVRNSFIVRNKTVYPCLNADIYIALTGHQLTGLGESFRGTLCNSIGVLTDYPDYPGISRIDDSNPFEVPEPGFVPHYTLVLAHEISHVIGATHTSSSCGDCVSNCDLMCATDCQESFKMDPCSFEVIKNTLINKCEECLVSFSNPEVCVHCIKTGEILTDDQYPFVPSCDGRNEFSITLRFINDCEPRTAFMRAAYRSDQLEVVDMGGFINDIDQEFNEHILEGPNVSFDAEEKLEYTVTFRLIDHPSNTGNINNLVLTLLMYTGNNFLFSYSLNPAFITYLVPNLISGAKNLTQLLEPQSGYLFDDDNISDCAGINNAFRIDGILSINSNYCFNTTTIIMDPEAKIIVKSGYTLTINGDFGLH